MRATILTSSLAFSTLACGGGESQDGAVCAEFRLAVPRPDTNLVLIVNDTMRRDRVGAYGGTAATPAFDDFSSRNLLFEHAYSQAPWTKPSMATIFTSLYPSQHGTSTHPQTNERGRSDPGVDVVRAEKLHHDLTTLAEVLQTAGYRTAAFVSNPWMERRFGFDQGFDIYDDSFSTWDVPGEVVIRAGLLWLEQLEGDEPFFLYLHTMDSHRPFSLSRWDVMERWAEIETTPVDPDTADAIAALVYLQEGLPASGAGLRPSRSLLDAAYDRGIERFDEALDGFLLALAAHDAFERTAVIITSDHGEALFERGYDNHGKGLYDDELAVPLAARLPGVSVDDRNVGCLVGLIDLMPTLCTYLQLECPSEMNGVSLFAESAPAARHVVAEGVHDKPLHRAIRDRTHKLILQPSGGPEGKRRALFDVASDPAERWDLLDPEHRTADTERIAEALARASLDAVPQFETPELELAPIDRLLEERLRSLGYLQ